MTDSGFTQFPERARLAGQDIPQRERPAQVVRVTSLPESLNDARDIVRVRGEVIRQKAENIVTVRTNRGDIDIQIPEDQPVPRKGARVEIEIQRGQGPREARIRTTARPEQNTTRSSDTPVEVRVSEVQTPTKQSAPEQIQPQNSEAKRTDNSIIGAKLRLQPITQKEAEQLIVQTQNALNTVQTDIIRSVTTKDSLTLISQILNIQIADEQSQALNTLSTQTLQQTSPKILLEGTTTSLPASSSAPAQILQTQLSALNTQFFTSALPAPQTTDVASLPAFQTPVAPDITGLKQPLDIQIQNALPFHVRLAAITESATQGAKDIHAELTQALKDLAKSPSALAEPFTPQNGLPQQAHSTQPQPALVTALTAEGFPVLSVFSAQTQSVQHFAVQAPLQSDLPVGSQIQIAPLTTQGALTSSLIQNATLSSLLTPGAWSLGQDILQTLIQNAPTLAQNMTNIVPQGNNTAQMTPAALFFIAAARGGDMSGWLGEKAMDILRRSDRGNLLSRLGQEGGLLSRLSSEPVSQDWRAMALPFFEQNEMQKMALFYRREDEGEQEQHKGKKQTRFIFNLDLSNIGPLQIDGLFRAERLDVIVRTEKHFSQAMQSDMRRLYTKALGQTETIGELSFQNTPESWVHLTVDSVKNAKSVTV